VPAEEVVRLRRDFEAEQSITRLIDTVKAGQ
jgi:hypothetical protein